MRVVLRRSRGPATWLAVLAAVLILCRASLALALVLQAPAGGEAITLPGERVLCGALPARWFVDAGRRRLRPPADAKPGETTTIAVAATASGCSGTPEAATLVVTGAAPVIDPQSTVASIDAGRLELRGDGLEGVKIAWNAGTLSGSDVCVNITKDKGRDVCAVNIDPKLPANPLQLVLRWVPPGGKPDADAFTYDRTGTLMLQDQLRISPARILLGRVFPPSRTADVASGEGKIQLLHPEAVSSADCNAGRCELSGGELVVRAVPAASTTISVRLHLLPRVFLSRGETADSQVTETLTVLRCPLTIVSGQPLRDVDDLRVLVRLDKGCNQDVDQLRWAASGEAVEVTRTATLADGMYALLHIGRISGDRVTIVATRSDDGSVIAVASERTWAPPPLVTSLGLPGYGQIEFIPKNRDALLSIAPVSTSGSIVPIAVPGAYTVERQADGFHVRGAYTSGGYTSLRFAYRASSVPTEFAETNLATLQDPVQRPIREASVPAPLGASSISPNPIVELICAMAKGKLTSIHSGTSPHIPFSLRDSCRLVIHRDRIPVESGEQRLDIDVSVTSLSGAERGEAKLAQHLVLRNGPDKDVIWVRGAKEQFDRINVRVTHVIDETEYLAGATGRVELPSAQWTVVTENANFKFYATAAIPASLYRFSKDPGDLGTGPLALNFGVLTRLTWLDHDGHDGIVGLETGVMAMGLETDNTRQLAIVGGTGVSVPLGNIGQPTQASVNIHAWAAYSVGTRTGKLTDANGVEIGTVRLNPWGFVFGPSITIGNIGSFL